MAKHTTIEAKILELMNKHRESLGLKAMEWNDTVQDKAKSHAQNIVEGKTPFGHDAFSERVHSLFIDLAARGAAENIARGQDSAEHVLEHWLNSALHKKNIEGNYNLTGISVLKDKEGRNLFVQVFIRGTVPVETVEEEEEDLLEESERNIEVLINKHRKDMGKPSLQTHILIQDIARKHAQSMAEGQVPLGHEGFKDRAHRIMGVMSGRGAAENVARWNGEAEQVVNHWLDSPDHRKNIEGNYQYASVGIAEANDGSWYFTQIFIRTK